MRNTRGWWTAIQLLALLLTLNSCMPMIPVPSSSEPEPYPEALLDYFEQEDISRADVEEKFGSPPIARLNGRVLIYAMAREKGGRLLVIAPPMIPVTIPEEELHFLLLEFDEENSLTHHELVSNGGHDSDVDSSFELDFHCSSRGVCVAGERWKTEGVFPFWAESGAMTEGNRTIVTAPREMEAAARKLQAPERGCVVYFLPRETKFGWFASIGRATKSVSYAVDGGLGVFGGSYLYGGPWPVFARWELESGRHVIHATRPDGQAVADYELVCSDGTLHIIAGENIPTVVGSGPKARFIELTLGEAATALQGRRLLLDP